MRRPGGSAFTRTEVATELMRNAKERRKLWPLRVEDWDAQHVFDVLFADIWQNVGEPSPERQARARQISLNLAALVDEAYVHRVTG